MGSISRSEEPACNPPRDGAGVSVEGRADLGLRFQCNAGDLRAFALAPRTRTHSTQPCQEQTARGGADRSE